MTMPLIDENDSRSLAALSPVNCRPSISRPNGGGILDIHLSGSSRVSKPWFQHGSQISTSGYTGNPRACRNSRTFFITSLTSSPFRSMAWNSRRFVTKLIVTVAIAVSM